MRVLVQAWVAELWAPVTIVAWAAFSLICGLAGPLGTFTLMPVLPRLLLWMALLAPAILAFTLIRSLVQGVMGLRDFWRGTGLMALLATLVLTLPYNEMARILFCNHGWDRPAPGEIGAVIFFAALGIGAYRHAAGADSRAPQLAEPPAPEPPPPPEPEPEPEPEPDLPRLVLRLDPAVQGRLISVSVRDHYVDVVTERGSGSLLMRLGDAIAETEGEAGSQIHRSHWVARHAVTGIERAQGKVFVRLSSGAALPVSRNHRDKIEDWGPGAAVPG